MVVHAQAAEDARSPSRGDGSAGTIYYTVGELRVRKVSCCTAPGTRTERGDSLGKLTSAVDNAAASEATSGAAEMGRSLQSWPVGSFQGHACV